MAAAYLKTKTEVRAVSASGTITLTCPAAAIKGVYFLNGAATAIAMQTGTITTATSSVSNAFAFTGTAESPSATLTANPSLGTNSGVWIEYVPAGEVGADE